MADENLVTIRDIDVPFWRIVMILVKWSIASIPAMIILMFLAALIAAIVGASSPCLACLYPRLRRLRLEA